jgi:catechol 2,3-dioxygenase-like lactoylglutathione lyase family enzyme
MITGFSHVSIVVPDIEAAVRMLADRFGLTVGERMVSQYATRLRENGDLLNYCNDHRIPLEICLSSNIQTRAAPDLASHPLPFFYTYGLRVTINTDNRLVTDTTVTVTVAARPGQHEAGDCRRMPRTVARVGAAQ